MGLPLSLTTKLRDESLVLEALTLLDHQAQDLKKEHKSNGVPSAFLRAITKTKTTPRRKRWEVKEELARNHAAREGLAKMLRNLGHEIEQDLETHLRQTNDGYIRGLASCVLIHDWGRALDRFEEKLLFYTRELGQSRNMVTSGYDAINRRISAAAERKLQDAAMAGFELEEETRFVNRVAHEHQKIIVGTPAKAALPTIPSGNYVDWTNNLRNLKIDEMQAEYTRILDLVDTLAGTGLEILHNSVAQLTEQTDADNRSYVLDYLGDLRTWAREHQDPHQMEPRIKVLEKTYGTGRVFTYQVMIEK